MNKYSLTKQFSKQKEPDLDLGISSFNGTSKRVNSNFGSYVPNEMRTNYHTMYSSKAHKVQLGVANINS